MKIFAHGVYACKLVANNLPNMTGQLGYVQPAHNMYNVLETDGLSNNAKTPVLGCLADLKEARKVLSMC